MPPAIDMNLQYANCANYEDISNRFKESSEFLNLVHPLLEALEWQGSLREVLDSLPYLSSSLDLTAFRNIFARLGYKSTRIKSELANCDNRLTPFLFVPDNGPSMIVISLSQDSFTCINGLNKQIEKLSLRKIKGQAFFFTAIDSQLLDEKNTRPLLQRTFKRFHKLIAYLLLASFFISLSSLATPIFVMNIYDKVIGTGSLSMLSNFTIGMLLVMLSALLLNQSRTNITAYIGARLDKLVGEMILERILYLPPILIESATPGSQLARLKDFGTVREFFASPFMLTILEAPFVIIALIAIGLIAGSLVIIPIVFMFTLIMLFFALSHFIQHSTTYSSAKNSIRQAFQSESIENLRTIKSLAGEKIWVERYKKIVAQSTLAGFKNSMWTGILNHLSDAILIVSGLIMIWISTLKVIDETLSVGGLIAIMMLTWKALTPIKSFITLLPNLEHIKRSIEQVNKLLKLPSEQTASNPMAEFTINRGELEFSRVSFRYNHAVSPSLLGISFKVRAHEIVCITGKNGSGKSTLLKLIPKLYRPQSGNIQIDGKNIEQIDAIELRSAIAYLPQEVDLFYGTIEQNLLFASPTATQSDIEVATKLAGIFDTIIALPDKFQTLINDNSHSAISATFFQGLALARTYIKKSGLILLDEPSTALDEQGENAFMNVLEHLRHSATIIIVTHRPSIMKVADRIIHLEKGQIRIDGPTTQVLSQLSLKEL